MYTATYVAKCVICNVICVSLFIYLKRKYRQKYLIFFLTVHLRIILVGNQHDAQFFYNTFIYLNPTACFEQLRAHPQEDNCMNTTSGIMTLC